MSQPKHPSHAMQLWQKGVRIKATRLELADPQLLGQLDELSKITIMSGMSSEAASKPVTNGEYLPLLADSIKAAADASTKCREINYQIDRNFMNIVRSGDLRCFAFESPRRMSSEPVEMQREHWTHFPNWETGEFKANGLHLIELRILQTQYTPEVEHSSETLASPGRPSIKRYVDDAFDDLHSKGKIELGASAKSHYPMIRQWISERTSDFDAKPLSDEGIRGHFSPRFNELKKTNKQ